MSELHVILGSGQVGHHLMDQLLQRGKRVRLTNRSGQLSDLAEGAEIVKADALDHESIKRACEGAEVIYNTINAPYTQWPELFPKIIDGVIAGVASSGAKLICVDNLYMYGPSDEPMSEETPYNAQGPKGKTRAQIAETLMKAHQSGKIRVAIARASDYYGPGVREAALGERVFPNALKGTPSDVIGNPDAPHTYTYVPDFANALIRLGEDDVALGEIWHTPNAETITTRQFMEILYQEAEHPIKIRIASRFAISAMGLFNPMMKELRETLYQFEQPFIVDHTKYAQTFGVEVTPHREAIQETLAWYREQD